MDDTPVITPIKRLFYSRKFLLAVLGLFQTVLSVYFQVPVEVLVSVNAVLMVLIGTIAYEDGKEKQAEALNSYLINNILKDAKVHEAKEVLES